MFPDNSKIVSEVESKIQYQIDLMKERNVLVSAFVIQVDLERDCVDIVMKPIPIVKYISMENQK